MHFGRFGGIQRLPSPRVRSRAGGVCGDTAITPAVVEVEG